MTTGDRTVSAGRDISGSIIQTGDYNQATLTAVPLPQESSVDIREILTELRTVLAAIGAPDSQKVERALDDAEEEVGKDEPDKVEVAGVLTRALGYAKKAADFSDHMDKIKPLVVAAAGWIGVASGCTPLLALLGLRAA